VVIAVVEVVRLKGNPHQIGHAHQEVHNGEVDKDSSGFRANAGNDEEGEDDQEGADDGERACHAHHSCQWLLQAEQAGELRCGRGPPGNCIVFKFPHEELLSPLPVARQFKVQLFIFHLQTAQLRRKNGRLKLRKPNKKQSHIFCCKNENSSAITVKGSNLTYTTRQVQLKIL